MLTLGRKDSLRKTEAALSDIVSSVFSDEHCYGVVSNSISLMGSILYEFRSSEGGDRFFMYVSSGKAEFAHGALPEAHKFFKHLVRYSNTSKEYKKWFEGKLHASKVRFEGYESAHATLNTILGTFRTNIVPERERHFMEVVKAARRHYGSMGIGVQM
ncbi:MAG: hypothetical protein KGH57_03655 [Candidatus Micrarchaeota archaeon]|nr:hypothetical protein [Candidatus Micrarchaeota archaeon]